MTERRKRVTKAESAAAQKVLKELWEKAYFDGLVCLDFSNRATPEKTAKYTFNALAEYRKKVRKAQLSRIEEWARISNTTLRFEAPSAVVLEKKTTAVSGLREIINLPTTMPELGLSSEKPSHAPHIAGILAEFEKGALKAG